MDEKISNILSAELINEVVGGSFRSWAKKSVNWIEDHSTAINLTMWGVFLLSSISFDIIIPFYNRVSLLVAYGREYEKLIDKEAQRRAEDLEYYFRHASDGVYLLPYGRTPILLGWK